MRIFSNILMSVSLLVAGLLLLSCDSIAGGDKGRKPHGGAQARNMERRNDIKGHQRDRRDNFKGHRKDKRENLREHRGEKREDLRRRRNDVSDHQRDRRDNFKEHRKDRQLRSGRQD